MNRVTFGVMASTATVLLAVSIMSGASLPAAQAADYPSWDEVNSAKQNEQRTQTEVQRITGLLGDLEAQAAARGDEAVRKGSEYLHASYEFEAAKLQANTLSGQAADAAQKADAATRQLGQLAAQLYRNGGDSGLSILTGSGDDTDKLLYQLGAMSKLTARSSDLSAAATSAANVADSLRAQARVAQTERDRLAAEAAERLAQAKAAQEAAERQVAEAKATSAVLYAQLASLKNTTAEVEEKYRQGVAAEEAYREQERRRQEEANRTDKGGGGGGSGSGWVPPSGLGADPDGAKAYAQSQMAPRGWDSNQFSCLLKLWTRESGWRVNAYNASSGAYGIPQSLPGSKMASSGSDWQTNAQTQINWGLSYISGRYGNPCGAWAHSEDVNWY